jgi:hypothetical protein
MGHTGTTQRQAGSVAVEEQVLQRKRTQDGLIDHFKAKLVAKGYTHARGLTMVKSLNLLLGMLP